jgi:FAD/FMN-containing dehydrogenase
MLSQPAESPSARGVIDALRRLVGESHVLVDPAERAGHEIDWTGRFQGRALAVVRPADAGEVRAVLRLCNEAGIGVVPQGGNTGLVGGGVPRDGEVVLSLLRLRDIGPIDPVAAEVTAGAGVTLGDVQRHAAAAGWAFGVDLASRSAATVGGMIATNAGGLNVLRHGPMAAQVLGVELALADGGHIERIAAPHKDTAGYDLAALVTGSEGTLAVVTRARLRLVPRMTARAVAVIGLPDTAAAVSLVGRLQARLPSLVAAELFFEPGVELVVRHAAGRRPFEAIAGAYLLVECADLASPLDDLAAALSDEPSIVDIAVATGASDRLGLWHLREAHPEAIAREGVPHKLDIAVPTGRLADFVAMVGPAVAAVVPAARVHVYGHVADGNLHVNVLGPGPLDDAVDDAVLRLAIELGGTISAEHGIGVAKVAWLSLVRGADDTAAMAAIKRALDPRGILNPGVLFPVG